MIQVHNFLNIFIDKNQLEGKFDDENLFSDSRDFQYKTENATPNLFCFCKTKLFFFFHKILSSLFFHETKIFFFSAQIIFSRFCKTKSFFLLLRKQNPLDFFLLSYFVAFVRTFDGWLK